MFTVGGISRLGVPFEYYYTTSAYDPYAKQGVSCIYLILDLLVYYVVAVIFFVFWDELKHRKQR